MLRIGSIVLRVDDLQRQAEFWQAALDYVRHDMDHDFIQLRPRNDVAPSLSLDQVPSTVQVPPRIHLDLFKENQADEVDRLKALGATEVHWDKRPPDADYTILADPEGKPLLRRGYQLVAAGGISAGMPATLAKRSLGCASVRE